MIYNGEKMRSYMSYFFCLLLSPSCEISNPAFSFPLVLLHSLAAADIGALLFFTFATKVMFRVWWNAGATLGRCFRTKEERRDLEQKEALLQQPRSALNINTHLRDKSNSNKRRLKVVQMASSLTTEGLNSYRSESVVEGESAKRGQTTYSSSSSDEEIEDDDEDSDGYGILVRST